MSHFAEKRLLMNFISAMLADIYTTKDMAIRAVGLIMFLTTVLLVMFLRARSALRRELAEANDPKSRDPGFETASFSTMNHVSILIAWLAVIGFACLEYWVPDRYRSVVHITLVMMPLIAVILVVRSIRRLQFSVFPQRAPEYPSSPYGSGCEVPQVAVLFVHGMGVQDRYQMLGELHEALLSYPSEIYTVSHRPTTVESTSRSFEVEDATHSKYQLDIHEAFWAPTFNGLTTFPGALLFTFKCLFNFIPTIATQNWKKRTSEALGLCGALVFGLAALAAAWMVAINASKQFDLVDAPVLGNEHVNNTIVFQWQQYKHLIVNTKVPRLSLDDYQRFVEPFKAQSLGSLSASILAALCFVYLIVATRQAWKLSDRFIGMKIKDSITATTQDADKDVLGDTWSRAGVVLCASMMIQVVSYYVPAFRINPAICLASLSAGLIYGVYRLFQWWTVNFAGDVQIYVERNENQVFFSARQKAIGIIATKIHEVCTQASSTGKPYDRVIVLSHSLGTSLTTEAIRSLYTGTADLPSGAQKRVNTGYLTDNFCTLITAGSPVRKVRQLFNTNEAKSTFTQYNQVVDWSIYYDDRHAYHENQDVTNQLGVPIAAASFGINWYNFLYTGDIFADPLRNLQFFVRSDESLFRDRSAFPVSADITLKHFKGHPRLWQHSNYWWHPGFLTFLLSLGCTTGTERRYQFLKGNANLKTEKFIPPMTAKHDRGRIYGASYFVDRNPTSWIKIRPTDD